MGRCSRRRPPQARAPARPVRRPGLARRRRRPRRPASAPPLERRVRAAELRKPLHQAGWHPLCRAHLDVPAERDLERVAPPTVVAAVEMELGLDVLDLSELAVEEPLEQLLAFLAIAGPTHAASSASCCFNCRRPRCKRDITVPIGIS